MKLIFSILAFFVIVNSSNADVSVEFKWYSPFGLNDNTFSPLHTYGVGNEILRNQLYELTKGELIFEVDTTKNIITDYTGKTFFVIDSIMQTLTVYDMESKGIIKELTYRNYIKNRAVSDSLMYEFDVEYQIIKLWNIYEDKLVSENDLKTSINFPEFDFKKILRYSFDGRFIDFSIKGFGYNRRIYDCVKSEFLDGTDYYKFNYPNYAFLNRSNILVYVDQMKSEIDTTECNYLIFYDLELRKSINEVKVKSFQNRKCSENITHIIISTEDKYILFGLPSDFFTNTAHGIYNIEEGKFQDTLVSIGNPPIYFSSSFIVVYGNLGYRVKTPTSVFNYSESSDLFVYPNPTHDYITITLSNKGLKPFAEVSKVQIFDVLGIEVLSVGTGFDLSTQRIDVSHLPTGVYFIRIGDKVEKFVKM